MINYKILVLVILVQKIYNHNKYNNKLHVVMVKQVIHYQNNNKNNLIKNKMNKIQKKKIL